LTQEQLADALGVTVGAVYKWEAGLSMPEIRLLMELADLFEVSVDSLLGYTMKSGSVQSRIERMMSFLAVKDYESAIAESEKALQKYPNNFLLVYASAQMYMIKTMEEMSKEAMVKSNELFEKAISLLDQNTDSSINEFTISNLMANNYLVTGDADKSLEVLKKNNICNINSSMIASIYAVGLGQPDEAFKYIEPAVIEVINKTCLTAYAASFAYAQKNDIACITNLEWLIGFFDSLKKDPESLSHIDKFKAIILALLAVWEEKFGYKDKAEDHIKEAYELATRFDDTPAYNSNNLRFISKTDAISVDNAGKTACEAVDFLVFDRVPKNKASKKIKQLWDELNQT
jgi:transcriptional regulator with XRE-family HTH domain